MQRTVHSLGVWLTVALGLLFGPWCVPARSAPPVQRDSRTITSDPYPDAAGELGFREWGSPDDNQQVIRATVRLDAERMRLLIMLPPETPVATAEQWLQDLSDGMKWQDVDLRANPQPERLYLRADVRKWVHSRGFGQSEASFDPALLAIALRKLTPRPALLGVRLVGSGLEAASIPPVVGGPSDGHYFLFYRLGNLSQTSKPLTLNYGIPRRWLAAGAAGLLLWLLFPPGALYAVRHYLGGRHEIEAKHRLTLYRRWQRGVLVVPFVLAMGALFLSRFWFLGYFGTGFAIAGPMLFLLPVTLFGLAGRLIGMPLERAAWPQRADLPWYRMVSAELTGGAVVLVMLGLSSFTTTSMLRQNGVPGTSRFVMLPTLLPLVIVLGSIAWGVVVTYRRKRGFLPSEVESPAELAATVREFTTRLGAPIERVRLAPARDGLMAGTVTVLGRLAVVGKEVTESLEPDQVAALIAATALAQPRTRSDRWITWGLSVGMLLPALVLLGGIWLTPGGFSRNRSLLPLMVLLGPLSMVGSSVNLRRSQKRQELADLQAAEALSEPRRFILALRRLEELQIASGGLDPAVARNSAFSQRCARLERRLGLE